MATCGLASFPAILPDDGHAFPYGMEKRAVVDVEAGQIPHDVLAELADRVQLSVFEQKLCDGTVDALVLQAITGGGVPHTYGAIREACNDSTLGATQKLCRGARWGLTEASIS